MGRAFYIAQGAGAGFFFGTASIFIRFLPNMDALSISFIRVLAAGLFLTCVGVALRRTAFVEGLRRPGLSLAGLGFFLALHFIFFVAAVKNTSVVNATTLVNTTPAWALLLGWLVGRIKPSRLSLAGLALTLAGVLSMTAGEFSTAPQNLLGNVYGLLGALFWALYLVAGKSVREGSELLVVVGPLYLWTAATTGVATLFVSGGITLPSAGELPPMTGLIVFPTILGHTLSFSSLKGLRPYEASALNLLEPLSATLLAALILYEVSPINIYLSAAVTLAGIYLVVSR
jgi:drug/metabolite transporter (DMT)-like permease